MSKVVVERSFDEPVALDTLRAQEAEVSACTEARDISRAYSVRSRDGRHVVCIYEAPDAEAVRFIQRKGGLPFDRIWTAQVIAGAGLEALQNRRERVIVQRELPDVSLGDYLALSETAADCLMRHRARLLEAYLSKDGRLGICHFEGIDAESVRLANEESELPFARAWTAKFHPAA